MLHKDAIARIIDPYGGPIGPKLHCSHPPGEDAQALEVVAASHLDSSLRARWFPDSTLAIGLVPGNALVFTNITSTPEVAGDTEAIVSCHVDEWLAFRRSGARLLLKWHRD